MIPGATYLGSMGPALVYRTKEQIPGTFMWYEVVKYYWRYYDKKTFYGPFDNQKDIETHVNGCLMAAGRHAETVPNNVVQVDFKLKKRIS